MVKREYHSQAATAPLHDRETMPGVLRKMAEFDPLRRAVLNEAADLVDELRTELGEREADDVQRSEDGRTDWDYEQRISRLTVRANPEMPSDRLLADWYNLAWSAEWNRIDPEMKQVTLTGADAEKCRIAGYQAIWRAGCDTGMVPPESQGSSEQVEQ